LPIRRLLKFLPSSPAPKRLRRVVKQNSSKPKSKAISDILREMETTFKGGETITVGSILHHFGVRGFAFLIFVPALLNIVIFMVPGLSLLLGLPLVILTVQMVLGLRAPLLPVLIRRRTIQRVALMRGLDFGIRVLRRVESFIRPRLQIFAGPHMDRLHSLLALLLSVLMAMPVPILNLPPSFGLIALALGMMQRDGFFIIGAYALAGWSLWLYGSLGHMAHILAQ
jgi:hypothetical protein